MDLKYPEPEYHPCCENENDSAIHTYQPLSTNNSIQDFITHMKIPFETAIEARKIVDDFHRQLKTLKYNPDLKKMATNLDQLVSDLSKAEVLARTNRAPSITDKPREELAEAIDRLDKYILMLRLFQ